LPIGSELLEHAPGDLTCIVEPGLRLSALQARLAAHGQMLALDPPGDPTIGECVDGNLSGPRRHRYGAPRDLVIGTTLRLADGAVASSGGKVVKNVAGYDLGKLVCGARGAFGELVRVALRLHPRPAAEATLTVPLDDAADAARRVRLLLASQLVPSAMDILVSGSPQRRLRDASEAPQGHPRLAPETPQRRPRDAPETSQARLRLAVLFEGSERAVAAQMAAARELLGGDEDDSVWAEVAAQQLAAGGRVSFDRLEPFLAGADAAVVRVSALNAYVPEAPAASKPSPLVERIRAELAG
jgi:FAD/FMN-containing dehydrogenase